MPSWMRGLLHDINSRRVEWLEKDIDFSRDCVMMKSIKTVAINNTININVTNGGVPSHEGSDK